MVEERQRMMYWVLCIIIMFVIFIVVTYFASAGFAELGNKILSPILDAMFGDFSVYVQGVLSVIVIIVLVLIIYVCYKRQWV